MTYLLAALRWGAVDPKRHLEVETSFLHLGSTPCNDT